MRELVKIIDNNRSALIRGDGGSYFLDLCEDDVLVETIVFNEHTLTIVEKQGYNWVNNEQIVRPTV